MITDTIADFITRIRNASSARKPKLDVNCSRMKTAIADELKACGFIKGYKLFKDGKIVVMRVYLKYVENHPAIQGITRLSKPGRRLYHKYQSIPNFMDGHGVILVSTSKGIVTDNNARKNKVGGELICSVW